MFVEEQKEIWQTMGWRDYNQCNLSAFDGDLGAVEVNNMRQIIQEQDEKKDEKIKLRLVKEGWEKLPLNVFTEGSMKPKSKRSNSLRTLFPALQLSMQLILRMMKSYDEFFTIVYFFANFIGDAPKKKTVSKVQR